MVRFDPLCLRPLSALGRRDVDNVEETLDRYSRCIVFEWITGSILILDNWRCLHARGDGAGSAPSRRLRRWYIGAQRGLVA
jgi:alpha-ketoglutarate-dependent taurine dioxygenase